MPIKSLSKICENFTVAVQIKISFRICTSYHSSANEKSFQSLVIVVRLKGRLRVWQCLVIVVQLKSRFIICQSLKVVVQMKNRVIIFQSLSIEVQSNIRYKI